MGSNKENTTKPVKIAIGIVDNHPMLYKSFAFSLVGVTNFFNNWANKQKQKYLLDIIIAENGRIDDMRNTVANQAIREEYDYIFWMDSDMIFPSNCLPLMLMYCEKDGYEAVSGLYTYKVPPYQPHIYPKIDEETGKFYLPTNFPLKEPFVIAGAGFGCLLMKTSVFERIKKPYFSMKFDDGKMVQGEDLDFCRDTRISMILDPNIRCGHMKTTTFGIDNFLEYNGIVPEDDWVKPTEEQKDSILNKMGKLFD